MLTVILSYLEYPREILLKISHLMIEGYWGVAAPTCEASFVVSVV